MKNIVKTLSFLFILISGLSIGFLAYAADPSVFVSPVSLEKDVGEDFDLAVSIKVNGNKVCAVEGKAVLDGLTCLSVDINSDLIIQDALNCDDLSFLLGMKGCIEQDIELFVIKIKGSSVGKAGLSFENIDVIGEGESLSTKSSSGIYDILPICECGNWLDWMSGEQGEGDCTSSQSLQYRERDCTPSACAIERIERCVETSVLGSVDEATGEQDDAPQVPEQEYQAAKDKELIPEKSAEQPEELLSEQKEVAGAEGEEELPEITGESLTASVGMSGRIISGKALAAFLLLAIAVGIVVFIKKSRPKDKENEKENTPGRVDLRSK